MTITVKVGNKKYDVKDCRGLASLRGMMFDKKSKNTYIVTFTIEVVKSVSYTLDMRAKPPSELSWTLVKGEIMKSNTGRWLLEEVRKGVTKAIYEVDVNLGLLVPAAITKTLISKDLPKMLAHFKARIEG